MKPILFSFWGFDLYAYTFFFTLAFVTGLGWSLRECKKTALAPMVILKLFFPIFIVSLIGARAFFALGAAISVQGDFSQLISYFLNGGFAYYGGFLNTVVFLFFLSPKLGLSRGALFNTLAPSLALSQAIGRLGCFFHGCCFGNICNYSWCIRLPVPREDPGWGLTQHPSQIYEFIGLILMFLWLTRQNSRSITSWPAWRGYLVGYGVLRFVVEFTRGDSIRGILGPFSLSQWVSVFLVILGVGVSVFLDFHGKGNHKVKPNEARS